MSWSIRSFAKIRSIGICLVVGYSQNTPAQRPEENRSEIIYFIKTLTLSSFDNSLTRKYAQSFSTRGDRVVSVYAKHMPLKYRSIDVSMITSEHRAYTIWRMAYASFQLFVRKICVLLCWLFSVLRFKQHQINNNNSSRRRETRFRGRGL